LDYAEGEGDEKTIGCGILRILAINASRSGVDSDLKFHTLHSWVIVGVHGNLLC
jgi:hypothetical protein